jgi:hypothetical protein
MADNNNVLSSKIKNKFMDIKRHFVSRINVINEAEKLTLLGIERKNKIYLVNSINILGQFISNSNVKEVINIIENEIKGK